jgi:hypothetical protein
MLLCCATDPTAVADAFSNMNVNWMLHTLLSMRFIAGSWRARQGRDCLIYRCTFYRSGYLTNDPTRNTQEFFYNLIL